MLKSDTARSTSTRSDPPATPELDIESLVRELQAGREERFQEFFRHYVPSAVYFFANRGFSRQDAEDLAQEALFRVYNNIRSFRHEASFDTWLFRILTNVLKNAIRSRTTLAGRAEKVALDARVELREGERPVAAELQDPAQNPLELALADERTRLLYGAIDQLSSRQRQCMMLRIGQGMKYREIAEVMGVGVSSVKTHLGTAHERLKPLLEKHFDVFSP